MIEVSPVYFGNEVGMNGARGSVPTDLIVFYQQKYLILPTARAPGLGLAPLILHPTPAYGVTKHNQSANLHRKLQRLRKGDGRFLPLISLPAMFLVLSKKNIWPFDEICKHF